MGRNHKSRDSQVVVTWRVDASSQ